ncbi:MAG: hypothetical protein RMJ56_15370 [Gemmataceae bacterium]|nr:hypothetical protein [Gemmata sp.]MDW8198976.1 hypothetical protein [Gemmataceae bacterium]
MIRRATILLGVPVVVAGVVAVPLGLVTGPYQWLCAAVAIALVVPPGLLTLLLAERLAKVSVVGPLLALVVGTAIRLAVGYGGAVLIFFLARPTFHTDPLSYFAWVLGLYLTTLVVETILLARGTAAAPPPPLS